MSHPPYIIDVDPASFQQAVIDASYQVPVMVDFWAPWCNPCKMLMPIVTRLAEEYDGRFILAKVNVDDNQELALQYDARSVPTVKVFRNGAVVDQFLGAQPEGNIRQLLENHIERASDQQRQQAERLLQQGEMAAAIELLQQANREDPDNPRVRQDLISLLFLAGRYPEVESAIRALPLAERESPEIKGLENRLIFASTAATAPDIAILEETLEREPGNSEARYQLAAKRVVEGDVEGALHELMLLLARDRSYGEDAARKGMLAILESADDPAWANQWRRRMASTLL